MIKFTLVVFLLFFNHCIFSTASSWLTELEERIDDKLTILSSEIRVVVKPEYIYKQETYSSPFLRKTQVKKKKSISSLNVEIYSPRVDSQYRKTITDIVETQISNIGYSYNLNFSVLPARHVEKMEPKEIVIEDKYSKETLSILKKNLVPLVKNFGLLFFMLFILKTVFDHVQLARIPKKNSFNKKDQEPLTISKKVEMRRKMESSDQQKVKDMKEDSLIAILTDCYWCNEDSYAKYIWDLVDLSTKENLLKKCSLLNDYAPYLETQSSCNTSLLKDNYYIRPLSIFHLSNKDLISSINKDRKLLNRLSILRRKKILTQYGELFRKVLNVVGQDVLDEKHLLTLAPSSRRMLFAEDNGYIFKSLEEEKNYFSTSVNLNESQKFLSLGWAKFLSNDELKNILEIYDVHDLASVWTGPVDELTRMKKLLNNKDQELLEKLTELYAAKRNSSVYRNLCLEISRRLIKIAKVA